jgi:hypothetical protein
MGYLGRRIGKSQTTANPQADGNTGGILDLFSGGYFQRTGNMPNAPGIALSGLTATGGVISDYTSGPAVYRAHVFTSTGTFTVTAPGDFGSTVEYLVVAGGGGGGSSFAGAGGAGGLRTNLSGHPLAGSAFPVSTSPGSYTITVGAGGAGASGPQPSIGSNGVDSSFGPTITSTGGGFGGSNVGPAKNGIPGGSGGSGGLSGGAGTPGSGVQVVEDKVEFLNPVVADQIKQVFPQQFLLVAEGVHLAVMIQVLADLVVPVS